MKIHIQANASIAGLGLDSKDAAFGISYGPLRGQTINNPIFSLIKFITENLFKPKVPKETQDFAHSILKTSKQFEQQVRELPYSREDLKVQLNTPSKIHSFLDSSGSYKGLIPSENHLLYEANVSPEAAHTYVGAGTVVIGSEFFYTPGLGTHLRETMGVERSSSIIFLHELAHNLDFWMNPDSRETKTFSTSTPYEKYFESKHTAKGEIYADVVAILLQRNFDMQNGNYNYRETELSILRLQGARNGNFPKFDSADVDYNLNKLTHFTTPGLQELHSQLPSYGDKPLTLVEINGIANKISEIGLARTMVVTASVEQCSTIFKQFDSVDSIVEGFNISKEVGPEWLENHKKVVSFLENNKEHFPKPVSEMIWCYEFQPFAYKNLCHKIEEATGLEMPKIYAEIYSSNKAQPIHDVASINIPSIESINQQPSHKKDSPVNETGVPSQCLVSKIDVSATTPLSMIGSKDRIMQNMEAIRQKHLQTTPSRKLTL